MWQVPGSVPEGRQKIAHGFNRGIPYPQESLSPGGVKEGVVQIGRHVRFWLGSHEDLFRP